MREIKFRGKRVDNGEWVFGFYVYMGVNRQGKSHLEFAHMILDSSSKDAEGLVQYEVIPETVGQFTGLRDKNGTKIFEGDVLFHPLQGRKKVFYPYSETVASYGLRDIDNGFGSTLQDSHAVWEVIGTIHDKED